MGIRMISIQISTYWLRRIGIGSAEHPNMCGIISKSVELVHLKIESLWSASATVLGLSCGHCLQILMFLASFAHIGFAMQFLGWKGRASIRDKPAEMVSEVLSHLSQNVESFVHV
jgi:hypothetical protein